MNCEHFQRRMQTRLDNRWSLDEDSQMMEHSERCVDCLAQLNAWRSIELAIGLPVASKAAAESSASRVKVWTAAAVAASALIAFSFVGGDRSEVVEPLAFANTTHSQTEAVDFQTTVQAVQWWETIRQRNWMAQTMPTVRSVQSGVAPLGRSLIQAVTILTVGDPNQTS